MTQRTSSPEGSTRRSDSTAAPAAARPGATTSAIGAHVDQADAVGQARARGADLVQFFLGDPQGWKAPVIVHPRGPHGLRAEAAAAGVDLYVHAPYLVNVASTNNRIRIPSRKILQQHIDAAAAIGAKALIVHGGHVPSDGDLAAGVDNWRKTVERTDMRVPVLIENTAGGEHAIARRLDALARLWDAVGGRVGCCLDTCHAHAAGEPLDTLVERVMSITGRIDLVHANDSKDPFNSGRDRHENLGRGRVDPADLIAVVAGAGAPVVCETPGESAGQRADIAWLRERLPAR